MAVVLFINTTYGSYITVLIDGVMPLPHGGYTTYCEYLCYFLMVNICTTYRNAQVVANCLYQAAGTCPPVAKYFHTRYAFFFGLANHVFQCQIKSHSGGLEIKRECTMFIFKSIYLTLNVY